MSISNGTIGVVSPTGYPLAGGGTLTISGSLNMSGNDVYPYVPGDLIAVNGPLTFSNAPTLLLPSRSLAPGVRTLMTYTGGTPDAADYMAMGGIYQLGPRQTFTFGTSGGTAVTLTVVGLVGNLEWNTSSGTWDVQNTPSWYNASSGSTDVFYQADNVTFNDRPGGAAASVNINAAVSPASMTVSNTSVSYTLNGTGGINGSTSLVKNGPAALTINTANGYTGGTFLNAGRLNVGNASALGSGALTIGGGSLDNTSGASMALSTPAYNLNGGFTFVGSYPLNLGTGPVALGTTPTVTIGAGTLTVGGNISGNYGLTVAGPGTLNLAATSNYTGNTTISSGVLQIGNSLALGVGGLVANGGTLDLAGYSVTVPSFSGAAGVIQNVTGATNSTLTVSQSVSTTFSGTIADGPTNTTALVLDGGELTLTGANTFTGGTTVEAGSLILTNNEGLADGSSLTVGNPSEFSPAVVVLTPLGNVASVPEPGTLALFERGRRDARDVS